MKPIIALVAVLAAALALASGAFASSITCSHGSNCNSATLGASAAPPTSGAVSGQTLPFTGLDLAGGVVIAGLLLGSGLTLRRVAGRRR